MNPQLTISLASTMQSDQRAAAEQARVARSARQQAETARVSTGSAAASYPFRFAAALLGGQLRRI